MKFKMPFLMAVFSVASVAQSQSGAASGVPSVAIPVPITATSHGPWLEF